MSFPQFLGEFILEKATSVVVSGTHGKTTTTALLSHVLITLGQNPGFLIGGIPRDFDSSFALPDGGVFVIEGDEYDTAYFDKNSKFLHYRPKHLIINNLEFDHADIFDSLDDIKKQFFDLIKLVPNKNAICANVDDPNVVDLLREAGVADQVTTVATLGLNAQANIRVEDAQPGDGVWKGKIVGSLFGTIETTSKLLGVHNFGNIAQAIAVLQNLKKEGALKGDFSSQEIAKAISSFAGVKRRFDHLGQINGIDVYEDFAHHPTAVRLLIEGFRKMAPDRRLRVAFEPRNATSRRNILLEDFAASLVLADEVYIGACPVDKRIAANERMNTQELALKIGQHAHEFGTNSELLKAMTGNAKPGDILVFMSSGSFDGIQHEAINCLKGD